MPADSRAPGSSSPLRVAITGASGFFGAALERRLAPSQRLRGLFRRRTAESDAWTARGHEVVFGDLDDSAALAALVAGVEVVHHLAARMAKGDAALSRQVNVRGTERLARAAKAAGVRRLVYVSSISVYAATPAAGGTITEATAPADTDTLNPYSATKYAGELALRALAAAGDGPPFTILRPTNVYGPGGRSWVLDWIRRLERLPMVLGGDIPVDLVHVDDVVAAIQLAGESPAAENETFHIGHETATLAEYGARFAPIIGRRIRRLPRPVDYVVRVSIERMYRVVKGNRMSMSLTRAVRYPHTRAARLIGYAPAIGLDEGFDRLARWYREEYRGAGSAR